MKASKTIYVEGATDLALVKALNINHVKVKNVRSKGKVCKKLSDNKKAKNRGLHFIYLIGN